LCRRSWASALGFSVQWCWRSTSSAIPARRLRLHSLGRISGVRRNPRSLARNGNEGSTARIFELRVTARRDKTGAAIEMFPWPGEGLGEAGSFDFVRRWAHFALDDKCQDTKKVTLRSPRPVLSVEIHEGTLERSLEERSGDCQCHGSKYRQVDHVRHDCAEAGLFQK
jgi:hypothetical protein